MPNKFRDVQCLSNMCNISVYPSAYVPHDDHATIAAICANQSHVLPYSLHIRCNGLVFSAKVNQIALYCIGTRHASFPKIDVRKYINTNMCYIVHKLPLYYCDKLLKRSRSTCTHIIVYL